LPGKECRQKNRLWKIYLLDRLDKSIDHSKQRMFLRDS
jgi:hypothetical protein